MTSVITPILLAMAGMSNIQSAFRPITTPVDRLNFKWRNQRQIRKNRRRANAAGKRNAFA